MSNPRLRSRLIDPGFFQNEELCSLPFEVRLLLAGLWLAADREGRLEDRPRRLRGILFPYDQHLDLDPMLSQLEASGFILRYSAEEPAAEGSMESTRVNLGPTQVQPRSNPGPTQVNPGRPWANLYIQIVKFGQYQKPHPKEARSSIPPPPPGYAAAKSLRINEGQPRSNPGPTQVQPRSNLGARLEVSLVRGLLGETTGAGTEPDPSGAAAPAPPSEIEWRVSEVWRAHLDHWRAFFLAVNGRQPSPDPTFTPEIQKAIREAIRIHDAALLGPESRERWLEESKALAAGIGIFLDPWCAGRHKDNDAAAGGKRYLEHWRPWKRQAGKGDPVDRFAELWFERRSSRRTQPAPKSKVWQKIREMVLRSAGPGEAQRLLDQLEVREAENELGLVAPTYEIANRAEASLRQHLDAAADAICGEHYQIYVYSETVS